MLGATEIDTADPDLQATRSEVCMSTLDELGLLSEEMPPAFSRVVDVCATLMRVPMASFSVLTDREYISKAVRGMERCQVPRQTTICHQTLQEDDCLISPDTTKDPRLSDNAFVVGGPKIRFYAGFKVSAPNGLPVGTVCVMDQKPRIITPDEIEALKRMRDLLQENLLLRARAITDPLTGVFNRRHFDEMLDKEWRRAYRHQLPITLMMIDVDHFKRYNDHYGHVAGDHALCEVAYVISNVVSRAGDIVGRFGGEEFAVLLPETDLDAANGLAQQILDQIRALNIAHDMAPTRRVSVSLGGTVINDHEQMSWGAGALVQAADRLLYQAKDEGRDCFRLQAFEAITEELAELDRH